MQADWNWPLGAHDEHEIEEFELARAVPCRTTRFPHSLQDETENKDHARVPCSPLCRKEPSRRPWREACLSRERRSMAFGRMMTWYTQKTPGLWLQGRGWCHVTQCWLSGTNEQMAHMHLTILSQCTTCGHPSSALVRKNPNSSITQIQSSLSNRRDLRRQFAKSAAVTRVLHQPVGLFVAVY